MSEHILKGPSLSGRIENYISLGQFLFSRAKEFSNEVAQIDALSLRFETYGSFRIRSTRIAIFLINSGVTANDRVLLISRNNLDVAVLMAAVSYLGAAIVCLEPSLSTKHMKYLISIVRPKLIFTETNHFESIQKISKDLKFAQIVEFGDDSATFTNLVQTYDEKEEQFEPVHVHSGDIAVIICSCGTTGYSKAICHSHFTLLNLSNLDTPNIGVTYHCSTFHSFPTWIMFLDVFRYGGCRIFSNDIEETNLFSLIERCGITSAYLSSADSYKLTRNSDFADGYNTISFKSLQISGGPLNPEHNSNLRTLFSTPILVNFSYGLTEIGFVSSFNLEENPQMVQNKLGSCGKLHYEVQLKITDLKSGVALGPNQEGEICVKSPFSMMGYFALDSSNFIDDQGYFKTGDVGYYDEDGYLYVVDRIKDTFRYLSWNIVPSTIESVLLDHPAVLEAVVFGIPRKDIGDVPTACVVLGDDCEVNAADIEKYVRDRVADRERLRGGVFVVEEMEKTPSGSVIRKKTKERYFQQILALEN